MNAAFNLHKGLGNPEQVKITRFYHSRTRVIFTKGVPLSYACCGIFCKGTKGKA